MSKLIVFQNVNLSGDSLTLTEADPNLSSQGWNDRISSLIVIDGDWDLYQNANYSGTVWNVSDSGGPAEDGVYPDYNDWNGKNDSISSLKPRG